MEELIRLLEDIKGALPLMIKLKAIDESAYKTLNESISEAIVLAKNNIVQHDVIKSVCLHTNKHYKNGMVGSYRYCNDCGEEC